MPKSWIVGSGEGSEIKISSRYISEQHAIVTEENQQYFIEDLQSTFGTFVNGNRIQSRTQLTTGDRVKIGTQPLHWEDFVSEEQPTSNPIFLNDLFSPSGLINWEDYKVILILALGAVILIPLSVPSILFFLEHRLSRRGGDIQLTLFVKPLTLSVSIIAAYIFLNLTQKALRQKFKRQKP